MHPVHCIQILARSLVVRAREDSRRISPIEDFVVGAGMVLNVLAGDELMLVRIESHAEFWLTKSKRRRLVVTADQLCSNLQSDLL